MFSVHQGLVRTGPPGLRRALASRGQHTGAIRRYRIERVGQTGGGGYTNFSELLAGVPEANTAWASVSAQLSSEGAGQDVVTVAQQHFFNAFDQLANGGAAGTGVQIQDMANAAQALVLNTDTIGGAVSNCIGLVSAGLSLQNDVPIQVATSMMGSMASAFVGAEVASGAVSMGVGAAIMAAVAILSEIMDSIFGTTQSPPQTHALCGGLVNNDVQPAWVIGCGSAQYDASNWGSGSGGAIYCLGDSMIGQESIYNDVCPSCPVGSVPGGPGSTKWRRFPKPGVSSPATGPDAWWFAVTPTAQAAIAAGDCQTSVLSGCISFKSSGGNSYPGMVNDHGADTPWTSGGSTDHWGAACDGNKYPISCEGLRPIDLAWPEYHQLECEALAAQAIVKTPVLPNLPSAASANVFAQFQLAYFAAWKLNAEYALNGLKARSNQTVLLQVLQHWNNAYSSSTTAVLSARPMAPLSPTQPCPPQGGLTPYVSMLIDGIAETVASAPPTYSPNDPNANSVGTTATAINTAGLNANGQLVVNTGPLVPLTNKSVTRSLPVLWHVTSNPVTSKPVTSIFTAAAPTVPVTQATADLKVAGILVAAIAATMAVLTKLRILTILW